jgi:8-oxo-dGTP diphosphatase
MVHQNAYESGRQKAIPAVLVYLRCEGEILMVSRDAKIGDFHAGKWNGLGGKLEQGESPWDAAAREVAEECGLEIGSDRLHWLGSLTFPNFKPKKHEDWLVTVFVAEVTEAERTQTWHRGPEGTLVWQPLEHLMELNLWGGDRHFLPFVILKQPFAGTIWYENGEPTRHRVERLG